MRLPVRLRWVVLSIVTIWIGGGLAFQGPPGDGDVNPLHAASIYDFDHRDEIPVLLTSAGPDDIAGCLRNCWFAGSQNSKLVMFQGESEGETDRAGWALLFQHGTAWHQIYEMVDIHSVDTRNDELFSLSAVSLSEGHRYNHRWGILRDYVVATGWASPEVVERVELLHDTGEVSSARLTGEYFVSFAPAQRVCEARALDHNGEVVATLEPGKHPGVGAIDPGGRIVPCEEV